MSSMLAHYLYNELTETYFNLIFYLITCYRLYQSRPKSANSQIHELIYTYIPMNVCVQRAAYSRLLSPRTSNDGTKKAIKAVVWFQLTPPSQSQKIYRHIYAHIHTHIHECITYVRERAVQIVRCDWIASQPRSVNLPFVASIHPSIHRWRR